MTSRPFPPNLHKMAPFKNCGYRFEEAPKELRLRQLVCEQTSVKDLVPKKYTLKGRQSKMVVSKKHFAFPERPLQPPFPAQFRTVTFSMGNFWHAERTFLRCPGIYSTHVGYTAGHTPNPTYKEVTTGMTNHAQCVRVIYDPRIVSFRDLCEVFWENHDPTQGNQQGKDVGTPFRSIIFYNTDEERAIANSTLSVYQKALFEQNKGSITTKIVPQEIFYYAEDYHQQYLVKNDAGYYGDGQVNSTGVLFPKEYAWAGLSRIAVFLKKLHVADHRNDPRTQGDRVKLPPYFFDAYRS